MTILNFVDQDQLDTLDDDPHIAFMQLCNFAQRSLSDQIKTLNLDDRTDWETREDLRRSFMNVILASAKRLKIEPFSSMEVPRNNQWRTDIYEQFDSDLQHYVTQIILDNSFRNRANSVALSPKLKDTVQSYVGALKDCISQSTLPQKKKDSLLKRLEDFQNELDKGRTNIYTAAILVFEILAIPGSLWASYDVAHRLTSQIATAVTEAKASALEKEKLVAPFQQLSAPRSDKGSGPKPQTKKGLSLEDDIPF